MKETGEQINNPKKRDSGGKLIFENATLCAQFLKNYTGIEVLKDVAPEDIEDMTERFIPMFTGERESDVVKKVRLPGEGELFLVTLIEHKSSVDYNVAMQVLRYMVYIWEDYENRMEAAHGGISRTKDFKYPPILPIVYYEGTGKWTAVRSLAERIFLKDVFGEYLPDYRYLLFCLQEHGREELLSREDEISFIMLMEQLQSMAEYRKIRFSKQYFEKMSERAPEDVLQVFVKVMSVLLRELNLPEDEIVEFTDQIKERKMGRFMEHFQGFDLPAARAQAQAEGRATGLAEGRATGLAEGRVAGLAEGRVAGLAEGRVEGEARMARLMESLFAAGRPLDAEQAAKDPKARERFYQEFVIG